MKQWWEEKLAVYEAYRVSEEEVFASEDFALTRKVVIRVKNLEFIRETILRTRDPYNQLVNVDALLRYYRSGQLEWYDNMVTYWSCGKPICEGPLKFHWDDVDKYHARCDGVSFWVEGVGLFNRLCNDRKTDISFL